MQNIQQNTLEEKRLGHLVQQAESHLRQGRLEQANDTIKRVLAMAPGNTRARRVLTLINMKPGNNKTRNE